MSNRNGCTLSGLTRYLQQKKGHDYGESLFQVYLMSEEPRKLKLLKLILIRLNTPFHCKIIHYLPQ
jgi:hypothetical protein